MGQNLAVRTFGLITRIVFMSKWSHTGAFGHVHKLTGCTLLSEESDYLMYGTHPEWWL